ncbi:MAG: ATP-dependent DNA ligase [Thermoproteota archaeon]
MEHMNFSVLVDAFEALERTTKRLEMTDILVKLFKKTPKDEVDIIAYLCIGEIYPPFVGIELGLADKLVMKTLADVTGMKLESIQNDYKRTGDLGKTAETLLSKKSQTTLSKKHLTVRRAYETFERICRSTGAGSQEAKINLLSSLIVEATPREASYIVKIALGRLRLGVADMTLLDALSIAYAGGKEAREAVERAYNLSSDIGYVAKMLAEGGIEAIKSFKITIGKPIRVQMAERMSSLDEIMSKLGGKAAAEYKLDGIRIEAHISKENVQLFSRREENVTNQFPDVIQGIRESISAKEAILDGECVPLDPNTGDLLPFQVVSQRRGRKHEIERMTKEVPVAYFLFDLLYLNGKDYTVRPYPKRREELERIVNETDRVRLTPRIVSSDKKEIERFFERSIQEGTEGLILKSIGPDSFYEAGHRGFQWIKWKRSYRSEMRDTVDLVVVGGFSGRGKRAGTFGALLMATYNPKTEQFETVCKLGSGFTDEDLAKLPKMFDQIKHQHPRVNSILKADYWFVPSVVAEVLGDEISLSPVHSAAYGVIKEGAGLAIRFPRFMRWREDRKAEDATTVEEMTEMYSSQLKKIESDQ